jgi:serine/threonine protein kinase
MLDRGIDLLRVCPSCWRCYDQRAEKCEADGASLQPLEALPFRIAGRYRMVRFVGEGGMGTVYRAHDERLAREVAVKVLRGEHFNNPTLRARFEHEARAVARIDHPGVIAVYDSGENEDGSLYIVMEWLSGVDLGQLLASCGPGTPREVAELLRQGAAALGAAHRAAIVHRDIKPENIFLSPAPGGGLRVKLLDFGVAKELAGESASLTQTGIVIGTPLYMAPEQVRGDPVGPRCDLYSFAAVAYEALCGRRVTAASDYVRILMAVVDEQPPPSISSALPDAPAEVDHAFARALAKRPDARPGDVEEWVGSFVDALERMPARAAGWGPALRELLHGEPTAEMTVARARHEAATAQALEERTRCERAPRRGGQ